MDEILLKKKVDQGVISQQEHDLIIQYQERLHTNGVPVIFNLRHVRKIFQITKSEQELFFAKERASLYTTFQIPKKSGGMRTIEAPMERLKEIQRWIKDNIFDKVVLSDAATGFKKGCSILNNAIPHVGKKYILNIDLKDFFPTISYSSVLKILLYLGYNRQVAHLLTKLCTNNDNVLPQGSPASPTISNIVCKKLDKRLTRLAETLDGVVYTRYADDMTFSSDRNIFGVSQLIRQIIAEENFIVNEKKIRIKQQFSRQEVTGLTVNRKVNISKKLIKEIENAIYYCQKYGVTSHMEKINSTKAFYKEHLYGIAYFVKMINEIKGTQYLNALDKIDWVY